MKSGELIVQNYGLKLVCPTVSSKWNETPRIEAGLYFDFLRKNTKRSLCWVYDEQEKI